MTLILCRTRVSVPGQGPHTNRYPLGSFARSETTRRPWKKDFRSLQQYGNRHVQVFRTWPYTLTTRQQMIRAPAPAADEKPVAFVGTAVVRTGDGSTGLF